MPPVLAFKAVVGASLACNPGPHVTDMGIADGPKDEQTFSFDDERTMRWKVLEGKTITFHRE